ncbi:MAG: sigma 54-interacting transcriptional regulator, partial [Deltaproteobacteria bacterium]
MIGYLILSRDAHDAFRLHRRNVAETGTTQVCEIELVRGDGKKFLARLESLETNGTMRILFIDLTADAISQRVRQECEQRFRAIFEESGDAIWFKDRDLRLTQVNSRVAKLFGRPAGELIGLRSDQVLGPELAKQVEQIERRVLSGQIIQHERTITVRGVTSVWNVILTPVRGRQNEIVGVCSIGRDISDSKGVDRLQSAQTHDSYPSDAMRTTLALARSAAKKDSTILLLGETGSGKDYLARYIHDHSTRAGGPFLSVNCAAIAPELAESELFGHEPGAFTGAQMRKRGLLELAEGGTLLLNEVGELSPALQAKLLTFLDTRKVTRVGGEKETHVNVRIVAATHRNLEKEVEAGRFRQDLFYRLNVISISAPPLRERREDIPILVQEILSQLQIEMCFAGPHKLESEALQKLANYGWPGNVR